MDTACIVAKSAKGRFEYMRMPDGDADDKQISRWSPSVWSLRLEMTKTILSSLGFLVKSTAPSFHARWECEDVKRLAIRIICSWNWVIQCLPISTCHEIIELRWGVDFRKLISVSQAICAENQSRILMKLVCHSFQQSKTHCLIAESPQKSSLGKNYLWWRLSEKDGV